MRPILLGGLVGMLIAVAGSAVLHSIFWCTFSADPCNAATILSIISRMFAVPTTYAAIGAGAIVGALVGNVIGSTTKR